MCATPPAESAGAPSGNGQRVRAALPYPEVERKKIRQKAVYGGDLIPPYGQGVDAPAGKGVSKKVFDELGISIIAVTDAHFNAALQCKQLESIKFLKPDLLISIPVDTRGTAGSLPLDCGQRHPVGADHQCPGGTHPEGLHLLYLRK